MRPQPPADVENPDATAASGRVSRGSDHRPHRAIVGVAAGLLAVFLVAEDAQEALVRKERLAILGELARGVGHELRNPLGVIKNSVYYLRMVLPEDERLRKHLAILERGVGALKVIKTATPRTNVIMMTAFTRSELVEEAREATAVAVLPKPLDVEQVLGLVARVTRSAGSSHGGSR